MVRSQGFMLAFMETLTLLRLFEILIKKSARKGDYYCLLHILCALVLKSSLIYHAPGIKCESIQWYSQKCIINSVDFQINMFLGTFVIFLVTAAEYFSQSFCSNILDWIFKFEQGTRWILQSEMERTEFVSL